MDCPHCGAKLTAHAGAKKVAPKPVVHGMPKAIPPMVKAGNSSMPRGPFGG